MTTLTDAQLLDLADMFEEAASDIEDYGWVARGAEGTNEHDSLGTFPRCLWRAFMLVHERTLKPEQVLIFHGEDYLLKASNVHHLGQLFDLNDSKSEEEGPLWAIETLDKAANLVRADLVVKEAVTDSIPQTDTGNATNVKSQQSFWHRLFHKG